MPQGTRFKAGGYLRRRILARQYHASNTVHQCRKNAEIVKYTLHSDCNHVAMWQRPMNLQRFTKFPTTDDSFMLFKVMCEAKNVIMQDLEGSGMFHVL